MDTLTLRGNQRRSKRIPTAILPRLRFRWNGAWLKALWGCHSGNAAGSPTSATVNAHLSGLPLLHGCRKMLLLEPDWSGSRTPTHASKADVG